MRTWFITGCSTGIGAGIAKAALAHGEQVVATARNTDKLKFLVDEYPETCFPIRLDVTSEAEQDAALKAAHDKFGKIDILVNNAGYAYHSAIEEADMKEVEAIVRTNFYGPMTLIKKVIPEMREARSGMFINVTSIAGVRCNYSSSFYSASKGALELFTEGLAHDMETLGVKVMLVEPGAFRTAFYEANHIKSGPMTIPDYAEKIWPRYPSQRVYRNDQPGDPARAGEVIYNFTNMEKTPLRYVMGSDAYRIVTTALEERLAEAREWEAYSHMTDFPKE